MHTYKIKHILPYQPGKGVSLSSSSPPSSLSVSTLPPFWAVPLALCLWPARCSFFFCLSSAFCVCMCVNVCLCVSECVFVHVRLNECVDTLCWCACMHVRGYCTCEYTYTPPTLCNIDTSALVCVSACAHMCLHICACTFVRMHKIAFMCVERRPV